MVKMVQFYVNLKLYEISLCSDVQGDLNCPDEKIDEFYG